MIHRKIRSAIRMVYQYIFRFKNAHYRFKIEVFDNVSKRYNKNKYFCTAHYIFCSYIYGCDLSEYFIYEFYKLNHAERNTFVTRRNKFKIYKNFSANNESRNIFNNKARFNIKFKDLIRRRYLYSNESTIEEIIDFIMSLDRIILKPILLRGGEGIFIVATSEIDDIKMFATRIKEKGMLIEEVLVQTERLATLNMDSVNTIRPLCVLDRENRFHLLSAILRVGHKGSVVDSISKGGVMYPIDVKEGCVNGIGIDGKGKMYSIHPGTNYYMPGYKIPKWLEVVMLLKEAMYVIPEVRLVAWDVCIKDEGVCIVEGNLVPNPRTFQMDGIGKKLMLNNLAP